MFVVATAFHGNKARNCVLALTESVSAEATFTDANVSSESRVYATLLSPTRVPHVVA